MAVSILRSRAPQRASHVVTRPHFGKPLSHAAERPAFRAARHTRPLFCSTSPMHMQQYAPLHTASASPSWGPVSCLSSMFRRYHSTLSRSSISSSSAVTWGENRDKFHPVHCPLCDYSMVHPEQNDKKPAFIFLDLDGVLINIFSSYALQKQRDSMLRELFPSAPKKYGYHLYYSDFQRSIVHSRQFDKDALKNLDKIIAKVEEAGKRPLVVLSSAWRHWAFLQQLRVDIFPQHTFSKYLCGKTPIDLDAQTQLAVECKLGFDFTKGAQEKYNIKLENRANAVEFWLKDHHFDPATTNFIAIDDDDQELSRFGEKFIRTNPCELLTDSNAKAAIDLLCGN